MIDSDGNELIYWPISGLIEGEDSEVLDFTIVLTGSAAELVATEDDRLKVWVRKVGDVGYTDLSAGNYDLTGLSGSTDFQLYVEALSPIEGLERVPVSVVAGSSSPAGWLV